jgi:hypothetical protein
VLGTIKWNQNLLKQVCVISASNYLRVVAYSFTDLSKEQSPCHIVPRIDVRGLQLAMNRCQ